MVTRAAPRAAIGGARVGRAEADGGCVVVVARLSFGGGQDGEGAATGAAEGRS